MKQQNKMDIEDFTNVELYEEGKKVLREMQNRGLTTEEILEKLEFKISLEVDFSEEDLDEMQHENKTFNWCFDGVDLKLYKDE